MPEPYTTDELPGVIAELMRNYDIALKTADTTEYEAMTANIVNAVPRLLATVEAMMEDATAAANAIDGILPFVNVCDDPECKHEKCVARDIARKAMIRIDASLGEVG